ncbi:type II toxin-antitoxin system death-on-curing family toxin [Enterococcus sp. BWM-S5]|uniref:Type II toxin-antitoxin system death-on-curing family toxin n=2 Tax=Enterococcus larvae TaxID=2794352 RepID=A0ABS4CGD9_9ENTE|nr:type II toxin-antitoxin system death-on-curing family toxin [Enterococcus larvae]
MKTMTEKTLIEINDFCQKKTETHVKPMYGVRESSGLASIAVSVDQNVFGVAVYPTVFSKAAFLWRSITNYHCFYNGNKRTGIVTAYVYLMMNGFRVAIEEPLFYDAALRIAAGQMGDEAIENLLEKSAQPDNSGIDKSLIDILEKSYIDTPQLKKLVEQLSLT